MNAGLLGRIGMLLVVVGGSAAATWTVVDHTPPPISAAGPAAWVDDPLDGSVRPADTGQLTVVAHATDPDGIDTVILSVDGDEVDTSTAAPDQLVTARAALDPTRAGHLPPGRGRTRPRRPSHPGRAGHRADRNRRRAIHDHYHGAALDDRAAGDDVPASWRPGPRPAPARPQR